MQLTRIRYSELNSPQKEHYNFHKVASLLADYGFNSIKLSDDWQGADFIACHNDGMTTLKVQLKSRPTIDKKYIGKDIAIAFPLSGNWYLVAHDELLDIVGQHTNWLNTESWKTAGCYHSVSLNAQVLGMLTSHKLE